MTVPRRLVPGRTHAVTRRTAGRCFFLRPSERVNQIVLYAIGVALQRNPGVSLHAATWESNHVHSSLTDDSEESGLSDYFRDLHSLTARALNCHFGRGENLWCDGSYDNVEIASRHTLEEQLLYLWVNPVQDGLTATPEAWPGVKFLPEDFGRTFTVEKPDEAFFGGRRPADWEPTYPPARRALRAQRRREREELRRREKLRDRRRGRGPRRSRQLGRQRRRRKQPAPRPPRRRDTALPERVTFTIDPPPGYEHMSLEEVRAHFRALLDARVEQVHAERAAEGLTHFMGRRAILAQDPLASAGETWPTFARNPRVAERDRQSRVALLKGLQTWRWRYREALDAWRGGKRDVVFPLGSYWLPRFHGALVVRATGPPRLA